MTRPMPEITYIMADPRFLKLRRAIKRGLAEYRASRTKRLSRLAYEAAEAAKLDRFVRNCALNGRIETSGWN